jgi:Na+-transporting methylmalonyl-CoA/oxaloacetate decarboxylase gamma subunit
MYQNIAQAILLLGQGMSGIFAVLGVIAIIVYAMQKFGGSQ